MRSATGFADVRAFSVGVPFSMLAFLPHMSNIRVIKTKNLGRITE